MAGRDQTALCLCRLGGSQGNALRSHRIAAACLTFGLEHTYEAILEAGFDKKPYDAYEYLTRNIDYIFDNQKRRALQKFWDSGLKVSPRVNPG